jgi:hypothetical protein
MGATDSGHARSAGRCSGEGGADSGGGAAGIGQIGPDHADDLQTELLADGVLTSLLLEDPFTRIVASGGVNYRKEISSVLHLAVELQESVLILEEEVSSAEVAVSPSHEVGL